MRWLMLLVIATACAPQRARLGATPKTEATAGDPLAADPKTSWENSVTVGEEKAKGEVWHSLAPGLPGQPASNCQSYRSATDNQSACEAQCRDLKNQGLSPCTCKEGPCPAKDK